MCLAVLQPHLSVMFVYKPICPLSVEYNESIIKGSPISKLVYEILPVQTKIINGRSRMKFYLKHRWGWGKASVGFDLDSIRTLVSTATVSSHRVTVGNTVSSNSRMF